MAGTADGMQQLASHADYFLLAYSGLPQLEEKLSPGCHTADFETLYIHLLFFWPHLLIDLRAEQYQCLKPEPRKTRAIWSSPSPPGINLCGKMMSFCL